MLREQAPDGEPQVQGESGKGRVYGTDTAGTLESIRREVGCINTKYLRATIGDWVLDYETRVTMIAPGVKEKVLKMSASTMDWILRGKKRDNWAEAPSNRRSGRNSNNPPKESVPCRSGEETPA